MGSTQHRGDVHDELKSLGYKKYLSQDSRDLCSKGCGNSRRHVKARCGTKTTPTVLGSVKGRVSRLLEEMLPLGISWSGSVWSLYPVLGSRFYEEHQLETYPRLEGEW